jgi:hypothetical protein
MYVNPMLKPGQNKTPTPSPRAGVATLDNQPEKAEFDFRLRKTCYFSSVKPWQEYASAAVLGALVALSSSPYSTLGWHRKSP